MTNLAVTWGGPLALTLLLLAIIFTPLYRRRTRAGADARERRLQIFRDQLSDLEREQTEGRIEAQEFEASKLEVQRRLLAAGAETPGADLPRGGNRLHLAIPLVLILLAGPALVYLKVGHPGAVDEPFASRDAEEQDQAEIAQALDKLKAHLAEVPTDLDGWTFYARSLRGVGRINDAADAYDHALKLAPDNSDVTGAYGELLVEQADGVVTPKALALFAQSRAKNPTDPRPMFYGALAKVQGGDREGALKDYLALAAISPKDAAWSETVDQRIAALAKELGRPTPEIVHKAPLPGPDAGQASAAAGMSDEDRQAMIKSMVARLDAKLHEQPDDPDGWQKLGRSYGVLGDQQKSLDAYREAATRAPGRLDLQLDYAHAIYSPSNATAAPPANFIEVMRHVLTLDPDQAEALWFVGRDETIKGNHKEAVILLTRLLDKLPADAPVRGTVQKAIDMAKGS